MLLTALIFMLVAGAITGWLGGILAKATGLGLLGYTIVGLLGGGLAVLVFPASLIFGIFAVIPAFIVSAALVLVVALIRKIAS